MDRAKDHVLSFKALVIPTQRDWRAGPLQSDIRGGMPEGRGADLIRSPSELR